MNLPAIIQKSGIDITFLGSSNVEEIESGIKTLLDMSDMATLVRSIAIWRIESEDLYRQAGFKTLREYQREQSKRLSAPRSTIATWRVIGCAYVENAEWIESRKIPLSRNISKLIHLQAAMNRHAPDDVERAFIEYSSREFSAWATGAAKPKIARTAYTDVRQAGNDVLLDGKRLLTLAEDAGDDARQVLRLVADSYRVRASGLLPEIIGVENEREAQLVRRYLEHLRARA